VPPRAESPGGVARYLEQLATGHIPPLQLLVAKTVGQEWRPIGWRTPRHRPYGSYVRWASISIRASGCAYLIRDARAPNKEERVRAFPRLGPDDGFDVAQYQAMLLDAALELLVPLVTMRHGYDRLWPDTPARVASPSVIPLLTKPIDTAGLWWA